jgi:hypothetical protein
VLFISVNKIDPYKIDNRDYKGYKSIHIKPQNQLWYEAMHAPWDNKYETPDFAIFTMKGSVDLECETNATGDMFTTCSTKDNAPGMVAPLDPLAVAKEFERIGITHGYPDNPNNDIHLVIYAERLPHDYLLAATLYWLLEFYGYPSEKLHLLDGGLTKWIDDKGGKTTGEGPGIIGTFIPGIRPEIFADKTLVKAVSEGLIKGKILDVRDPTTGGNYDSNRNNIAEPGWRDSWPADPWWDFMQSYHFKNDQLYRWDDSIAGIDSPNKCSDLLKCYWKSDGELKTGFDKILGALDKDDLIITYCS